MSLLESTSLSTFSCFCWAFWLLISGYLLVWDHWLDVEQGVVWSSYARRGRRRKNSPVSPTLTLPIAQRTVQRKRSEEQALNSPPCRSKKERKKQRRKRKLKGISDGSSITQHTLRLKKGRAQSDGQIGADPSLVYIPQIKDRDLPS